MTERNKQTTDLLIVGGGLCGLNLARQAQAKNLTCRILEGRPHVGGRILSRPYQSADTNSRYDLGPAWFWPHHQHIRQLIEELNLQQSVFEQHGAGAGLFENSNGQIQSAVSGISMAGSYRLAGGMQSLTDSIVALLEPKTVLTNCVVQQIELQDGQIDTHACYQGEKAVFHSEHVVIALPPRVAMHGIQFMPTLAESRQNYLENVQTWMAAQGKVIVEYAEPFWRQGELSGDAFSLIGPMRELHDASSIDASHAALFGFLDDTALSSSLEENKIKTAVIDQLTRLFGNKADRFINIDIENWSTSTFTCTSRDREEAPMHSFNTVQPLIEPGWQDKLIWSGSETANAQLQINGYLEGAVVASQHALSVIVNEGMEIEL